MTLWNTQDVVRLVKTALAGHSFENDIDVQSPGGDYDTEELAIGKAIWEGTKVGGLFMCGFNTDHTAPDPSNMEVEMVMLTDGLDSRGGLNSSDEAVCTAYAAIFCAMRKAGFDVVNQIKDYF